MKRNQKTQTVFVALEHWNLGARKPEPRLVTRRRNGQFLDNMSAAQLRTVGIKGVR